MSIAPVEQSVLPGAKAHSDGGWEAPAGVPVQTRSERFASANPEAFPPVTGQELEWKLTPVPLVRTLIDGPLDGTPYSFTTTGDSSAAVGWIDRADASVGAVGLPEDRASATAWATFDQALAITVEHDDASQLIVERADMGSAARAAHTIVTALPQSRGSVIIHSRGDASLVENIEVVVRDGAALTLITVQEWGDAALHLASIFVTVGRDAMFRHVSVSLGGAVVRVKPSVHLVGDGAEAELFGVYFADAGQHLEQRVYLHHAGKATRGRVNYKGALQGAGARTVWVGDVLIGRDAAGTDSYEQNRNLVLTEGTRADSIPNLEIETGDIIGAGHASATGRFDDEQLFYLQARGISEFEARRLVVTGFLSEIVQKVGNAEIEAHLHGVIERELASSSPTDTKGR